MAEKFVNKVNTRKIILKNEFEKESFNALSDLSMRYSLLETQLYDSVSGELLNMILSSSTDFDDFKIKYNKYLRIKNNNSRIQNFIKKDLNINFELKTNNRVIKKTNRKIGTIISNSIENNEDNHLLTVKFNNNNKPVKISPYILKKIQ
jgi:hypothetical protein